MKTSIIKYIKAIEKSRDIKVLLACETGSRAWGFPSPDSDYDVRLIYVHSTNWYLSLEDKKDSLSMMFDDNEIDITGWDLRKSLRLLSKSNAALLERIQSPIIYLGNPLFISNITELAKSQYSKISTIHHYLGLAKKCLAELKENESYKLKKLFYGLRSATACLWILNKDAMPPIEFKVMLDGLEIESTVNNRINELIKFKATKNEDYLHNGDCNLIDYIEKCISLAETNKHNLPPSNGNKEMLNSFFIKTVTL